MKTILSGVVKPVLLSKRLIVAKIAGLIFSLLAGLSVGKEGPFVHVSSAIADQFMRLSLFKHLRTQDAKRLEVLACACASGVSGSFGTAFGGVLFSIEFTASAYSVRTLPKAFLTSAVAMIVFFLLGVSDQLSLFNANRNVSQWLPYAHEMASFVLIGFVCGLLGVLFVYIVEYLTNFRNWLLDKRRHSQDELDLRRVLLVAAVTLVVSVMMYFEMASIPEVPRVLIDYMFEQDSLQALLPKLMLYFPYKFAVTALSVTLPLPVGLFTPVFMTGSVLGRIIGETLCSGPQSMNYSPSDYSILAAAAFSTGVTRAISTAVIVYELSGEPHLRLPLSIVILIAYFVGNRFSKNIYDVLIDTSGTPYMQEIPPHMLAVPVAEGMLPVDELHVLALNSTYQDARLLLEATSLSKRPPVPSDAQRGGGAVELVALPQQRFASYGSVQGKRDLEQQGVMAVIPVVQSRKSMVIVGAVLREDVKSSLDKLIKMSKVADMSPVTLGLADESQLSDSSSVRNAHYKEGPSLAVEASSTRISSSTDSSFSSSRDSKLATAVSNNCNRARESVASTARFPYRLLGVNPFGDEEKGYSNSEEMLRDLLDETIQFIVYTNGGRSMAPVTSASVGGSRSLQRTMSWQALPMAIPIDPSPYQIVDTMHLCKVDLLFRMLSLNQAYVTNSGRLVGLVTRSSLRSYLGSTVKRPLDRCSQLFTAFRKYYSSARKDEREPIRTTWSEEIIHAGKK